MIMELYYDRISRVKMPKLPSTGGKAGAPSGAAFGERVRELRKAQGLTLENVSEASGLSRASMSKIERGEMSPTYASLLKIARGLGTDVCLLISGRQPAGGGYAITRAGKGSEHRADKRFPSRLLAPDLPDRSLYAFITEVHCVPIEKYGPWDSHDSEDFLYVLDGVIEVHLQGRTPVRLRKGDSMQMDGRIAHALIAPPSADSKAQKPFAQLLWISVPFA
jgi:transcriptional regulator with XRE-family HTH domain